MLKTVAVVLSRLIITSCVKKNYLEGVWTSPFEPYPNLRSQYEMELRPYSGNRWIGKFEIADMTFSANLPSVIVEDSLIDIDTGGGYHFKGIVPREGGEITGIFSNGIEYGYQWWRTVLKVRGVGHPVIFGSGYAGQFIWIIPDVNIVVVTMNHTPMVTEDNRIIHNYEMEEIILPSLVR